MSRDYFRNFESQNVRSWSSLTSSPFHKHDAPAQESCLSVIGECGVSCQQCSAAWSPLALLVSLSGRSWWWSADSDATGCGTPWGAVSSPLLQHRKDLSLLIEAWSAWQVMGLWGARRGEIGPCSAAASNLLALSMQAGGLIHWPLAGRFVIAHF